MGNRMALQYGVHSEAGTLRRAMVHRPGLEMARLTPEHREALLLAAPSCRSRARAG